MNLNLKRTFGAILTSLGILILLYGGYSFVVHSSVSPWKTIVTALVLGIIFFGSGIGLVKGTNDD
jgi:hypothetical protein